MEEVLLRCGVEFAVGSLACSSEGYESTLNKKSVDCAASGRHFLDAVLRLQQKSRSSLSPGRSKPVVVHHQCHGASQSRLAAIVCGPEPGHPDQRVSVHLGLNHVAEHIPD